jgi:hypothetical protein
MLVSIPENEQVNLIFAGFVLVYQQYPFVYQCKPYVGIAQIAGATGKRLFAQQCYPFVSQQYKSRNLFLGPVQKQVIDVGFVSEPGTVRPVYFGSHFL